MKVTSNNKKWICKLKVDTMKNYFGFMVSTFLLFIWRC